MRDLLDKLKKLEEGFMPKEMEGETEFEFTGDDGETGFGTLYYKAQIKQSDEHGYYAEVDPTSLRGEAEGDGNNKLDDDLATAGVQSDGPDHEAAMDAAFDDAMDQIKNADTDVPQESIADDSDEQTFEDELPKITDEMNGMISDWIEKFSKFIGGNGDTLPDGYIQWALNSGITTDFVEQNEAEAMREKYGEDEFENDPLGHVDEMPITKAALEMIEKITGNDDIDTNARMIDKVQSGDADESTELSDIKQLSGLDTNEEEEQTFEGEEFYEYYGYLPWHEDIVDEAEYQGRKVKLGKPMQGDVKKFKVYVRDPKTKNVKKVNFGDPNMRIKKSNPARRKSFRARHNCDNPGPRTKARYWSCRKW